MTDSTTQLGRSQCPLVETGTTTSLFIFPSAANCTSSLTSKLMVKYSAQPTASCQKQIAILGSQHPAVLLPMPWKVGHLLMIGFYFLSSAMDLQLTSPYCPFREHIWPSRHVYLRLPIYSIHHLMHG